MSILNFNGLIITETERGIKVDNMPLFNLSHIFDCGQCFRWHKCDENSYEGVAGGKYAIVRSSNNTLLMDGVTIEDFCTFWYTYFDLDNDYEVIRRAVADDRIMKQATEFGYGIRLLKQDFNEMVISFIISANNNIPRISASVEKLSRLLGSFINENAYSFPTPETFAKADISVLHSCGVGFRDKYIKSTANDIFLNPPDFRGRSSIDARNLLMKYKGIGPKVADCILLFSGLYTDIFPKDVWVYRVLKHLYPDLSEKPSDIDRAMSLRFGSMTGYAQQYLFYYARENGIGK